MDHEDAIARATTASQPSFDFTGEWTNRSGSTMNIVEEAGVLIGVFASAGDRDEAIASGQLSGQAAGELIAFTVKWPAAAITAWVGRHRQEPDKDIVDALWQMTAVAEGTGGARPVIFSGADQFERPRDKDVDTPAEGLAAEITLNPALTPPETA